jgi:predicted AlkP superfamily pyrophosphatase or phosphodiesterase
MKETTSIVAFIDALGWEVLRDRDFMEGELTHRQKVRSVFGYSSACVPSILSGVLPREHKHWSFFYYDKNNSPFARWKWLRFLPGQSRGRVRSKISQWVKRYLGWTGYFQFYNMPFNDIDLFNYCEKNDIFAPGGLNSGKNIADYLEDGNIPYHISDWRNSEDQNLEDLKNAITQQKIRFAFLYMASMDALLHQVGKEDDSVDSKLEWYERQLRDLIKEARANYKEVRLFVCSDHGMATVNKTIDLMPRIESLGWKYGKDYVAAYDSTMARFWFLNPDVKASVCNALEDVKEGKIVSENELVELGCDFAGNQYGDLIFLLDPGAIICPSHMGTKPITGMHGYHPDDADSDAVLLSNVPAPVEVTSLIDICPLMRAEAGIG